MGFLGWSVDSGLGLGLEAFPESPEKRVELRVVSRRLEIACLDCENGLILGFEDESNHRTRAILAENPASLCSVVGFLLTFAVHSTLCLAVSGLAGHGR